MHAKNFCNLHAIIAILLIFLHKYVVFLLSPSSFIYFIVWKTSQCNISCSKSSRCRKQIAMTSNCYAQRPMECLSDNNWVIKKRWLQTINIRNNRLILQFANNLYKRDSSQHLIFCIFQPLLKRICYLQKMMCHFVARTNWPIIKSNYFVNIIIIFNFSYYTNILITVTFVSQPTLCRAFVFFPQTSMYYPHKSRAIFYINLYLDQQT